MDPLGRAFGGLDGERLQRVTEEVLPFALQVLGSRADAFARRREHQRDRVERQTVRPRADEVGEAQPLARRLTREGERRGLPAVFDEVDGVSFGVRLEKTEHRARTDPAGPPDAADDLFELRELGIRRFLELPVAAAQTEMLRVQHVRIDVGPNRFRIERRVHVLFEVGRPDRRQDFDRGVADRRRGERVDFALGRGRPQAAALLRLGGERGPRVLSGEHAVGESQPAHRVLGVHDEAAVRRGDPDVPATRIRADRVIWLVDPAALG